MGGAADLATFSSLKMTHRPGNKTRGCDNQDNHHSQLHAVFYTPGRSIWKEFPFSTNSHVFSIESSISLATCRRMYIPSFLM